MNEYFAEFVGTAMLILLGNGAVANVVLRKTKGENSGWIVITAGWGMGVFIAVLIVGPVSGAHINPAVTMGLAITGLFEWNKVVPFLLAQMLGAMAGGSLVYLFYRDHFNITDDPDSKLACFCTLPNIRNRKNNFISEVIGTFVLVFAVLFVNLPFIEIEGIENTKVGLGSLEALPVGLVVFAIGLSLGGTTGYAINPARDMGPRIMHALLPIKGKRDSDWTYSWVPAIGPLLGASIAALLYFFTQWIS